MQKECRRGRWSQKGSTRVRVRERGGEGANKVKDVGEVSKKKA